MYYRVSTDMQVEQGHSLDSQQEDLQGYCQRRGWKITAAYHDDGLSGRRMNRPGIQELINCVQSGQVDVVIVPNISRLFRKLEHLLAVMKVLKQYDVAFISLEENIDFTTPWGKLTLAVLGTLAEIYVDQLSQGTSRGKRRRASEGDFNGSIPFGYCNGLCVDCTDLNGPGYCPRVGQSSLGSGKIAVPHPIDSQAVRLMFEWYATGDFSDADIAHKLNEYTLIYEGKSFKFRPKRLELKNGN